MPSAWDVPELCSTLSYVRLSYHTSKVYSSDLNFMIQTLTYAKDLSSYRGIKINLGKFLFRKHEFH